MKKIIAMVAGVVLCMTMLTGCGGIDPVKYVDSSLNYVKTGEITEDLLSQSNGTKEEYEEDYNDTIDDLVDGLADSLGEKSFKKGENRAVLEEFAKTMLGKMTYEVNEDYKKDGDNYQVEVAIETYDVTKLLTDVAEDCADKWTKKATSYTNVDDLMEDYYLDCFKTATEKLKTAKSVGSETVTLNISPNDEGVYEVDESDLQDLTNKMFKLK